MTDALDIVLSDLKNRLQKIVMVGSKILKPFRITPELGAVIILWHASDQEIVMVRRKVSSQVN